MRSAKFQSLAKRQTGISAIEYLVLAAIVIAAIATAAALFADDIEAAFAALGALL
jgi:Flp pilus assembly pilin Flp